MTVDTFESPRRCESPKTSTVTRLATLPSAIPVSVDIFEFRTSSESRKMSTVTRMATVTPAIPVTCDTFRRGGSSQTIERKWSQTFEKKNSTGFEKLRVQGLGPYAYMEDGDHEDVVYWTSYFIDELRRPSTLSTVVAGVTNPVLVIISLALYLLDQTAPAPQTQSMKLDFSMRSMDAVRSLGDLEQQQVQSVPAFLAKDFFSGSMTARHTSRLGIVQLYSYLHSVGVPLCGCFNFRYAAKYCTSYSTDSLTRGRCAWEHI